MTVPGFNETFHPFYDTFSISRYDFQVPDYFDIYAPDFSNEIDFKCLSVICPNPSLGAKRWTINGHWITIGIYRDEGRKAEQRPPTTALSWTRVGKVLTIVDPAGHRLRPGAFVDVYNVNVGQLIRQPITIIDGNTFTVPTLLYGPTSGVNGAYQPSDIYDFYEENYVFRLLPSFKLIPVATVMQIFQDAKPSVYPQVRDLYNITTASRVKLPTGKNQDVNYDLPVANVPIAERSTLERRFDQQYDEQGNPLKILYREDGQPAVLKNYDEKTVNANQGFNQVPANINPSRVVVYDFYGLEVNDINRGPYFRTDMVIRDTSKPAPYDNIRRAEQNGVALYDGKLYDVFGNLVIGIQTNDATVVRQNLLPLKLDRFNRPMKLPIKRSGKLLGY